MEYTRHVSDAVVWVGGSDRRLALFENLFPIPRGVSYNSYVILDEKTALLDTVDSSIALQFIQNVRATLGDRPLDYLIVNHMEPDHCATIEMLLPYYPNLKIVGNAKTFQMIRQFYDFDVDSHPRPWSTGRKSWSPTRRARRSSSLPTLSAPSAPWMAPCSTTK